MSATSSRANPDVLNMAGREETDKREVYARAEQTMRRGKWLVVTGFVLAMLGIVAYSVAALRADMNLGEGVNLVGFPGWQAAPPLAVIGIGVLLWLIGSFIYLNGEMDSDPARHRQS